MNHCMVPLLYQLGSFRFGRDISDSQAQQLMLCWLLTCLLSLVSSDLYLKQSVLLIEQSSAGNVNVGGTLQYFVLVAGKQSSTCHKGALFTSRWSAESLIDFWQCRSFKLAPELWHTFHVHHGSVL